MMLGERPGANRSFRTQSGFPAALGRDAWAAQGAPRMPGERSGCSGSIRKHLDFPGRVGRAGGRGSAQVSHSKVIPKSIETHSKVILNLFQRDSHSKVMSIFFFLFLFLVLFIVHTLSLSLSLSPGPLFEHDGAAARLVRSQTRASPLLKVLLSVGEYHHLWLILLPVRHASESC